jgi:hypothetical protein
MTVPGLKCSIRRACLHPVPDRLSDATLSCDAHDRVCDAPVAVGHQVTTADVDQVISRNPAGSAGNTGGERGGHIPYRGDPRGTGSPIVLMLDGGVELLTLPLTTVALLVLTFVALHHQHTQSGADAGGRGGSRATDGRGQLCDFSRQPYQVRILGVTGGDALPRWPGSGRSLPCRAGQAVKPGLGLD